MKKLAWTLFVVIIVGCNNPTKEASPSEDYRFEAVSDEDVAEESVISAIAMPAPVSNSYLELSEQKLQELFENIYLSQKHSEFGTNSSSSLSRSNEQIAQLEFTDRPVVSNVKLIGSPTMISDSMDEIVMSYELKANGIVLTDTISAIISKTTITIDDQSLIDMQFEFKTDN